MHGHAIATKEGVCVCGGRCKDREAGLQSRKEEQIQVLIRFYYRGRVWFGNSLEMCGGNSLVLYAWARLGRHHKYGDQNESRVNVSE